MSKLKTVYVCSKCHYQSPRWSGQCFNCKEWNTFVEDVIDEKEQEKDLIKKTKQIDIFTLGKENLEKISSERLISGIAEFDRVLGGGFVHDSITLFIGDPGIGKSTLTLQIAGNLAKQGKNVLYISGEESVSQIAGRANRLFGSNLPNINIANNTDVDSIIALVESHKPDFTIIDSINILNLSQVSGSTGSVSQIRACAEILMHFFKKNKSPLLIIGQVTKEGEMAGPQTLAHLVDVVVSLEGERYHQFRMLRGIKNRFGTTSEVGVFSMEGNGLSEVENPSKVFLDGRIQNSIGSAITVTVEGTRPFLVEIQSLVNYTNFSYPKRVTSGIDVNRLNIMIAILQKYAGIKMNELDVFSNAVGGFRVSEPALDLALCASLISSKNKKPLSNDTVYFGEVGLSGEVRSVPFLDKRLKEAEKLGFKKVYMPKVKNLPKTSLKVVQIENIGEILDL